MKDCHKSPLEVFEASAEITDREFVIVICVVEHHT